MLNRTAGAGQSITCRVKAIGSLPLTYQWRRDGSDLPGATDPALQLVNLQANDVGNYAVVITNAFGATTSAVASLTVTSTAPMIITQAESQQAAQGSTVSFSVGVTGSEPFRFQWQWHGTNLAGATDASIVLANVQFTNSGPYRAIVSNAFGFALSSDALLSVLTSLEDALDTTGLIWTTSGDGDWFGQSLVTYDLVDAAQTGPISDNQQSALQTTISGPATVSFWWKVSSEQDWDTLVFRIGGAEMARISGEVDWQTRSFAVPAGSQLLSWVYSKDGSASVGEDAAWLDQINFTGTSSFQTTHPSWANNTFHLAVQTTSGKTYVLEFKNSLKDPVWTAVDSVSGDGTLRTLTDFSASTPQRFYRVRQQN